MDILICILIVVLLAIAIASLIFFFVNTIRFFQILRKTSIRRYYKKVQNNDSYVKFQNIPKWVPLVILGVEDASFFKHKGYNLVSIKTAFFKNIKKGKLRHGGSTITQQLARFTYLHTRRTFSRKYIELLIALRLEKELNKCQILEWYINIYDFRRGGVGAPAASMSYFRIPITKLSFCQALSLSAIICAPTAYCPHLHPENWKYARRRALAALSANGFIFDDDLPKFNQLEFGKANKYLDTKYQKIYSQRPLDSRLGNLIDEGYTTSE